jgi:hypothetical protein
MSATVSHFLCICCFAAHVAAGSAQLALFALSATSYRTGCNMQPLWIVLVLVVVRACSESSRGLHVRQLEDKQVDRGTVVIVWLCVCCFLLFQSWCLIWLSAKWSVQQPPQQQQQLF